MDTVITGSDIERGLRRLGVRAGMALEVHCALGRFGHVDGGANTVIDALMRAVGIDGALVMPAFRLSPHLPLTAEDRELGLVTKIRILPENAERSAMGIVADTFRRRPEATTGAGVFRVSAWGRDADQHAAGFQRLIDIDGYALLLGTDIYSLSAMHYVEAAMPDAIRDRFKPSDEAGRKYPKEEWLIEAWKPEAKPWYTIQDEAYARGYIADTNIGNAKCLFFKVRPVIELYRQALSERPFELYGLR